MAIKAEQLCESVTLYEGDCLEVLPTLAPGSVDAVVTDPPYGIGAGEMSFGKWRTSKMVKNEWDNEKPDLTSIIAMKVPTIIFGGNYFGLPSSRRFLIWDKGAGFKGRDFSECEMAWCSFDGNAKVFTYDPLANRDYHGKLHPTQKPLSVMQWAIEQLPNGCNTILDPFGGSGTTSIAAMKEGRRCIIIEKEPKYCEIIRRRVREADGAGDNSLFKSVVNKQAELFASSL